jgi:hypothetical protein
VRGAKRDVEFAEGIHGSDSSHAAV